jgi:hypothetical protein
MLEVSFNVRMLEVGGLPLFLYSGTLISAIRQGELAWSIDKLGVDDGAASIYLGAYYRYYPIWKKNIMIWSIALSTFILNSDV